MFLTIFVSSVLFWLSLTFQVTGSLAQYYGDFDYSNMGVGMGGGNQRCKEFKCKQKGYAPVPKRSMKFTSAGCDAIGGAAMMFDGDNGKPYESCCDEWHACFQICGSNKQTCDDDFDDCVDRTCQQAEQDEDACQQSAKQTKMMLNLAGCRSFDAAQNKACECATQYNNGHMKKREEALRKFYKLYAPTGSESKVPELLQKTGDSAPKLAKLLAKLIRKYPEAIELVEDPQTKKYREMMGGMGGAGMPNYGYGGGQDPYKIYEDMMGGAGGMYGPKRGRNKGSQDPYKMYEDMMGGAGGYPMPKHGRNKGGEDPYKAYRDMMGAYGGGNTNFDREGDSDDEFEDDEDMDGLGAYGEDEDEEEEIVAEPPKPKERKERERRPTPRPSPDRKSVV